MFIGIIFGIIACALWGLVYIIPLWLSTYDPMLIALARYTIFGLFSAVLLFFNGKYLSQVSKKDWISATALGVVGNLFFLLAFGLCSSIGGAPIAGAFTAVIPISVAIVANSSARRCGAGVPWSSLVFPLSLVAAGMVCLNWTEFSYFLANSNEPPAGFWLGVFYAFFKFASLDVVSDQQCELVNCASENFSNVLDGSSRCCNTADSSHRFGSLCRYDGVLNFTLGAYTDTFFYRRIIFGDRVLLACHLFLE